MNVRKACYSYLQILNEVEMQENIERKPAKVEDDDEIIPDKSLKEIVVSKLESTIQHLKSILTY